MNKIAIVYIATKGYNRFFESFIDSLKNFCPSSQKIVFYLNDECNIETYRFVYGIDVIEYPIEDNPWPLVTLLKFKYVSQVMQYNTFKKFDPDYIFYFNANINFIKIIDEIEYLNESGLTAVYHYAWTKLNHNFIALGENNYKSQAFVGHPYEYFQACQLGGKVEAVKEMCDRILHMLSIDLANYIIPRWHDESYYNKYLDECNLDILKLDEHIYNCDITTKSKDTKILMKSKDDLELLKDSNYLKTN